MDVSGTWKGEYTFEEGEEGEGRAVAGNVVTFTMKLKQGWFGSFTGTVQDDPRTGFQEEGTIKGKVRPGKDGPVMVFEKMMPMLRLIHESSRITLERWAERLNVVMGTKIAHPKIRHIGDLSADGKTVDGTWLMQEESFSVPGSGQRPGTPDPCWNVENDPRVRPFPLPCLQRRGPHVIPPETPAHRPCVP